MTTERYDHEAIETRWQAVWDAERAFETPNPANPTSDERPHSYVLEMLPYPSGELHMGHVSNYTMGDVVSHFRRRHGHAACCTRWATTRSACRPRTPPSATGGHPARRRRASNIAKIRVADASAWAGRSTGRASSSTADPGVLPLDAVDLPAAVRARAGVQEATATVNWCPVDQTVLANEQVIDGHCERCGAEVEARVAARSGTSRSPTTPSGCWTTWRCWRAGPSAC